MSKKLFSKIFVFLLVVGLLFAVAPTRQALAQTPTTLNVADWSETASVGVTGRPSVLLDGTTYHLWYGVELTGGVTELYHTTSTTPGSFSAGTKVTFDTAPSEQASVTVIKEADGFKMIAYGTTTQEFALYTSSDGTAWTKGATVFTGTGLPDNWQKLDAPFLLKDGTGYKLYIQVKETDTNYKIYLATSTTIGGTYTLANNNSPVLTPDTGETRVHHPAVVKDGSQYYMWYATQNQLKLGLAKSTDGINWVKSLANPIVSVGNSAEPSVIKVGDTWHMYFMQNGAVKYIAASGPFEFQTIQAAVTKAVDGDVINVAAGTYDEENITITKGITLLGAGAATTSIAPAAVTNNSTLIVNNPSGNVRISGFNFVMQPKPNYGSAVVVTGTGIAIDSATVTISNNVITGSGDGSKSDYGFYGQNNNAKVIIENNTINNTGDNPICFEGQAGSTQVINNEFHIVASPDYDPYYSMAYGDLTVSTPQIVERNTFFLDHTGSGYASAITFNTAPRNEWSGLATDSGHYTNILIKDNVIYTNGPHARGINLADRSAGGNLGTITGAVITGNQIIGENLTDVNTYGMAVRGDVQGTKIQSNIINKVDLGIRIIPGNGNTPICPSGSTITSNQITSVGVSVKNECTSGSVDVSPNWWGSAAGPAAGQIVGDVTYIPWCGDEDCTTFMPNEDDEIVLPEEDTTAEDIQTAINNAPEYTTIIIPAGDYSQVGAFEINTPHITITLSDGTVIQNSSPCFEINASYTTITGNGAVCVPTESSNGINVAGDLTNITIEWLEIDGSDPTGSGDGIHFAGAVTDVILRDNFIHNLGGDGVHFTAQPAGYVEIKGNLFMDNAGEGVDNTNGTAPIDATYNAWGDYNGPTGTNGDGVSANVTYAPFTHVDVYVADGVGSRYPNEVALGDATAETITYNVYANLQNALGAQFTLTFDPAKLQVTDTDTAGTVFPSAWSGSGVTPGVTVDEALGKITFAGGAASAAVSGEDQFLFSVTFAGVAPTDAANALSFNEADEALFGMNPGSGSSLNIYAAGMAGVADVNVYDLPTLAIDPLATFAVGNPKEFTLTVSNPSTGRAYTNLVVNLTGLEATLEYYNGSAWVTYTQGTALNTGRPLNVGDSATVDFRVSFTAAGTDTATVSVYENTIFLMTGDFVFTVLDAYDVTGSVQMQGRTVRSGVSVGLAHNTIPEYLYNTLSTDLMTGNYTLSNVAEGGYTLTITHDRYLDFSYSPLTAGNINLTRLELRGGDVVKNNAIDISDASLVGTYYNIAGDNDADANFDETVNIFDLAMVGGNYGLTSGTAYASWTP
jgi:hypothetical protein